MARSAALCSVLSLLALIACGRTFEREVQRRLDDGDALAAFPGGFDPARLDAGSLPPLPTPGLGRPLVFAVPPFYADEISKGAAQALEAWLSERIGVPVEVKAPAAYAYETVVQGLQNGTIDVAELSPYGFALMAERRVAVEPLVATVANGTSTYASYLVVKRGSPITRLEQARGKKLAFVDPLSTSGYLLPTRFLKERGYDVEKDFIISFAGGHPQAVQQVRDGTVDVAAVSSDLLIGNSGLAGPLRVIAKAGRIPYDVVVARADLDPVLRLHVRAALLALSIHDERGRAALKAFAAVDAFMPVPEGHYDEVRSLARGEKIPSSVPPGAAAMPVP